MLTKKAVVVIDLPRVAAESVTPVTKSFTAPDFPQPLNKGIRYSMEKVT